jgi:L-threonylcarbamoyladenylate synthase
MSQVYEVDPARLDEAEPALVAAVDALTRGELVVMPTETVYGIACRPDLDEATDRLFAAKRRPRELSLPVLAPSADSAWEIATPNDAARSLARAFWPGPLTMVLARTRRSHLWNLGHEGSTVAVRVPDHPLSLELLRRAGHLAVTSANLSGLPPLSSSDRLIEVVGAQAAVLLVLAQGVPAPEGLASTVVDLTKPTARVLRPGPIGEKDLDGAVRGR